VTEPVEIEIVSTADRTVTDDEVRGFHELISEPEQRRWDPGDEALDLPAVFSFFREVLPERPHQAVFLARAEGVVVGMAALFVHKEDLENKEAKVGFGVKTGWMGRGVARELVRTALAHAEARGLERVRAEVFPHNLRAIRLLNAAGFTIVTPLAPHTDPVGLAVFEKVFPESPSPGVVS
jgi:RimJ/RimL family protein N-acetyltransferase